MANRNITEKAIQEAFLELLNEKNFNKITVKDITERCGINRNTFYYHYQDIYAVLEQFCAGEVDRIVQKYPERNSIRECIEAIMDLVRANRKAVAHICNSPSKETYIASLWRVSEYIVTTYANTAFADMPLSEEDRQLFIRYYKCSCFGLVLDWINTGMKDEYSDGIIRIFELKKGTAELTIQNCLDSYNKDNN